MSNSVSGNNQHAIRITSSNGGNVADNTVVVTVEEAGGIRLVQDGHEASGYVLEDVFVLDNLLRLCR